MISKSYIMHKETVKNIIYRSLQVFGKQGITFLIFVLAAKLLSPPEFGIYNYLLASVLLLMIFCDFGISAATQKYVAEYSASKDERAGLVLFNSAAIILAVSAIVAVIFCLIGPSYFGDKYKYALYLLPLLFLSPMTSLYDGVYCGLGKFRKLTVITLIAGLSSLAFIFMLTLRFGLRGALLSQVMYYALLLLLLCLSHGKFKPRFNPGLAKKIMSYSMIIGLSSIGFFLYTRMGIIILGKYDFILAINHYEIINRFLAIVLLPAAIVGQVISPTITKYTVLKRFDIIKAKFQKYMLSSLAVGIVASSMIFFLFPWIVKVFLKDYYDIAFLPILFWTLIIFPFSFASSLLTQGFTVATGKAKYGLLTIPFGVLSVIASVILIGKVGYMGVIYSVAIFSTLSRLASYYLLYRDLGREAKNG